MSHSQGFTILEIMIVTAIIGMVTVLAVPTVSSYFQVTLSAAAREMGSTIKEGYNATVITGKVHRLVMDLGKSEYWVEVGPSTTLLDTAKSQEREERRKRFTKDEEKEAPSAFQLEKTITRKKVSLPMGASFEDVTTQAKPNEPLSTGMAYAHFFPHGITEKTIIHLKDESNHKMTMVITPILGRTDVYERYVPLLELNEK